MDRKKTIFLCFIIILNLLTVNVFATDIDGEKKYKPLDMVVVIDTSGSMNYSDSTHMTSSAVNMLINMMPAEDSKIGIVTFNTKPMALTTDSSGNPTLFKLSSFDNVKNVKQKVSSIAYKGDTGIGNAIKMATDMLDAQSKDDSRQKAIILFTDGIDDFGQDQFGLARCKENQSAAVQWATNNNCPIYCIGYNYRMSSGENSMGQNKEGIRKLESLSKPTGGYAEAIEKINDIENMFITVLANICDLHYRQIETVPGDGQRHEVHISVSPEVIEANIRITCPTKEALSNGKIELYNPQNEKVVLQNGNGVRYDIDATAVSIKVLSPKTGSWNLILDGIKGEEIRIGLLEHYELGIVSKLSLPENNPPNVAYIGDTIGISTYLTTDGKKITDNTIYETVNVSRVIVTPREDPDKELVYTLKFDGSQYTGLFEISEESVYDVTVEIGSDSFIRADRLTIQSNNHPLVLEKNIENVKVNKNKQIAIDDIYTYVSDFENDPITAEITNSTEPDMADVRIDNDKIIIDGLGWGATDITVTYKDAQGNTVMTTFKVSINDPIALAIIIGSLSMFFTLIALLIFFAFRSRIRLFGKVLVCEISEGTIDTAGNFVRNSNGFSYINPNANPNMSRTANGGIPHGNSLFQSMKPGGIFGARQDNKPQSTQRQESGSIFASQGKGLFGNSQNFIGANEGLFKSASGKPMHTGSIFKTTQDDTGEKTLFGSDSIGTETEISNQYNTVYSFVNNKQKKNTIEWILAEFLKNYSDFMSGHLQGKQSAIADEIKQMLSNISAQTSKMVLHGTIGGKGGAVLKVNKNLLKKEKIKMITPHFAGNRAELQYYKKGVVELDFAIITDGSTNPQKCIRVFVKLQRN